MIDDEQLGRLFQADEGDRLERKRAASDFDVVRRAVCALANDLAGTGRPGVLFIGRNDDKSCADLTMDQRLVEGLANLRGDGNIQPFPIMTVVTPTIGACPVIAVIVAPSDNPPVRTGGRPLRELGAAPVTRRRTRNAGWSRSGGGARCLSMRKGSPGPVWTTSTFRAFAWNTSLRRSLKRCWP